MKIPTKNSLCSNFFLLPLQITFWKNQLWSHLSSDDMSSVTPWCPEQCFSNLILCQSQLEGMIKCRLLKLIPEFLTQYVWSWVQEFEFLSSHVLLLLLAVCGPILWTTGLENKIQIPQHGIRSFSFCLLTPCPFLPTKPLWAIHTRLPAFLYFYSSGLRSVCSLSGMPLHLFETSCYRNFPPLLSPNYESLLSLCSW